MDLPVSAINNHFSYPIIGMDGMGVNGFANHIVSQMTISFSMSLTVRVKIIVWDNMA